MITRITGYLDLLGDDRRPPLASAELEAEGYARVCRAFDPAEVEALRDEVDGVFDRVDADVRNHSRPVEEIEEFRYEMLNRSALVQQIVGDRRILGILEPLLAEDCHVIANTAWRNERRPPSAAEGRWHTDAGPHIPRPAEVPWDERIAYPVFAVGVHVMLEDCPAECGPTEVIPGSNRSGRPIPAGREDDDDLDWNGRTGQVIEAEAGDLVLFTSDTWHRRHPPSGGSGRRFFLQVHYGRRDLAQRLRPTREINHLSAEAFERATEGSSRDRSVVGLHKRGFYDA